MQEIIKTIDIIYSRVSKEDETLQDLEIQQQKIIEKFKLENPLIYKERGTAYNLEKFHKRTEFIKILQKCFDFDKTTIKDIFLNNHKRVNIRLFAWDSHRIMRNMQFGLFFLLLSEFFGLDIYTYKDGKINGNKQETPSKKLLSLIIFTIYAYSGEEYSYTTSENIKKSVKKENGISIGTKKDPDGTKWGRPFVDLNGKKIRLGVEKINILNNRIIQLANFFQKKKIYGFYPRIIKIIETEFKIKISKAYITKLRLENEKRNKCKINSN